MNESPRVWLFISLAFALIAFLSLADIVRGTGQ